MLSREIVEDGYRRLCMAFGRKTKADIVDIWWESLRSRRIVGESFADAVDGIIEGESSMPPLKVVLEYVGSHRGREKGTPYLYGRPLRDVLDDIEEGRNPLEWSQDPPGFWKDDTERLTYLNAVEGVAGDTGGLPITGGKLKPSEFLKAVAERAGAHLPKPAGDMKHILDDGIDDEVPF